MPFLQLPETRLHYELSGDAGAPVLVLAHSLGVSLAMWQPLLSQLLAHFRVLRYDARGHGRSAIPGGPLTVETLGLDVLALLDAIRIPKAHFCGLSMGGAVGQWLGIHAPERLLKLVLANTSPRFGEAANWDARIDLVRREGLAPVIAGTLERWFTADFRITSPDLVAQTRHSLEATDPRGYIACCAAVRDADFRASAKKIHVPTLVIAGSHDPVSSPADGHFLASQIQAAEYIELPAAHLSSVEAPDAFAAVLLSFLLR